MRNPFLIIRSVFFCMLGYLSLLRLIFVSWNINATTSQNIPVAGVMGMLLFNSAITFILLFIGLVELVYPKIKTARVSVECAWVLVLALLEIGGSIAISIHDPTVTCPSHVNWSICTSISLTIPAAWLSGFTVLAYFFTLFCITMAHMSGDKAIWSRCIYDVPWLTSSEGYPVHHKNMRPLISNPKAIPGLHNDSWTRYMEGITRAKANGPAVPASALDIEKAFAPSSITLCADVVEGSTYDTAPWARRDTVRRGVDHPFKKRASSHPLPPLPLRIESKERSVGSRFIERFRESILFRTSSVFAEGVTDHNKPIPLPRHSQWIHASPTIHTTTTIPK